jgi:hypothetical protein
MENPYEPPGSRLERVERLDPGPTIARPRHTSLVVLGILNIVFGSLGLLCCSPYKIIGGLAAPARFDEGGGKDGAGVEAEEGADAAAQAPGDTQDLFMRKLIELASTPMMRRFNLTDGVLGFVASAMLIVGGCGLIMQKKWGRLVSIICAFLGILSAIAGMLVQTIAIIQPLMRFAQGFGDPAAQAGVIGAVIGAYGQGLMMLIYPAVLLILLTRPRIQAAFQA